ncbi:MAG: DUF2341 domain-containing protein [Microscillaceae bacterium]|nr:DUF2341 domain-containing protein [Microscillaceae bacterium]
MKKIGLLGIIICLLIHINSSFAQEDIDDWKYQKELWIDHQASTELLEDYQIFVEMNTLQLIEEGKLSPSGRDLRIFDPETKHFLCYWLENEIFSSNTKIWFRVPQLLPKSRKKIYLCYGNPDAQKVDYQSCTFQFFDDFVGNTLDEEKWEAVGNGTFRIQNGLIAFEGLGTDILIRSTQHFEMPLITEMKVTDSQGKYLALALIKSEPLPYIWEGYTLGLDEGKNKIELMLTQSELSSCGAYNIYPTGIRGKLSENNIGIWSLSWITRNTIFANWPGGDLLEPNAIWSIQQLDIVLGVLACDMGSTFQGKLTVDWVRVRKLAANPPALTLGIENSNPKIGTINYLKDGVG